MIVVEVPLSVHKYCLGDEVDLFRDTAHQVDPIQTLAGQSMHDVASTSLARHDECDSYGGHKRLDSVVQLFKLLWYVCVKEIVTTGSSCLLRIEMQTAPAVTQILTPWPADWS